MAKFETTPRLRRKAGLKRLEGLLDDLRALGELREVRPGNFHLGSRPLLHFHYHPDGEIVADVRHANGRIARYDVSDDEGQQELLSVIEDCLQY